MDCRYFVLVTVVTQSIKRVIFGGFLYGVTRSMEPFSADF